MPPRRVLAVTFTNKAARELRERLTGGRAGALLAEGVGAALEREWRAMAAEADAMRFEGNIWPMITSQKRWHGRNPAVVENGLHPA